LFLLHRLYRLVFEDDSSQFHAKAIQTFQKLFQVDPEGVIPAMSQLRMNLESKSNFVKRIKVLLKMGNTKLSFVLRKFEKGNFLRGKHKSPPSPWKDPRINERRRRKYWEGRRLFCCFATNEWNWLRQNKVAGAGPRVTFGLIHVLDWAKRRNNKCFFLRMREKITDFEKVYPRLVNLVGRLRDVLELKSTSDIVPAIEEMKEKLKGLTSSTKVDVW
jgi:hypothetical protein